MNRLMIGLAAMSLFACRGESGDRTGDEVAATQSELEAGRCGDQRCGLPLGMPTLICSDGTVGGNTGRCIADPTTNTCHWEVRTCPPTTSVCGPNACGPALGLPAIPCADGSTGGNTGRCLSDPTTNSCHWEIRQCPPSPTPTPGACGPDACGPALGRPAIPCADGSTGGNTGRCLSDPTTNSCHWEIRTCP